LQRSPDNPGNPINLGEEQANPVARHLVGQAREIVSQ
jgi:hypothetical protein